MATPIVCEWPRKTSYLLFCVGPGYYLVRRQRIIVDVESGTITFECCHWPRRFWAISPEERHVCPLDEIVEIHRDSWLTRLLAPGRWWRGAWIVTRTGKACINALMTGFEEVMAAIRPYSKPGTGRLLDNQNAWMTCPPLIGPLLSS